MKANIFVLVMRLPDVIKMSCLHFDQKEAPVLRKILDTYFEKHLWTAASENQHLFDEFTERMFFSIKLFYVLYFKIVSGVLSGLPQNVWY